VTQRTLASLIVVIMALAGCQQAGPPPTPHYVLGGAYQAAGVWYYPKESFDAEKTGLAMAYRGDHAALTTDGEAFDQSAMAGAHQTLQLPAVVRLTNLENGLTTDIRLNDRGPSSPNRLVAVTRRVADLLQFPADGVAPVRLTVLGAPSHALVEQLGGGATPALAMTSAPRGEVQSVALAAPAGIVQEATPSPLPAPSADRSPAAAAIVVPSRLPETLTREPTGPVAYWIRMGTFSRYVYAGIQRARVAGLAPSIDETRNGRERSYRVRIGPFNTPAQADAALDQVIGAGVTDARIVVE
jgi:rare lipoprotein A